MGVRMARCIRGKSLGQAGVLVEDYDGQVCWGGVFGRIMLDVGFSKDSVVHGPFRRVVLLGFMGRKRQ